MIMICMAKIDWCSGAWDLLVSCSPSFDAVIDVLEGPERCV